MDETRRTQPAAPAAARGFSGSTSALCTSATGGSFQCVPGFHKEFTEYVAAHGPDEPLDAAKLAHRAQQIPGKKGDLLIWSNFLPHGNGRNTDTTPRMAQYLAMWPAGSQPDSAT